MYFLKVGEGEIHFAFARDSLQNFPHFVVVPPVGAPIRTRDVNLAVRYAAAGTGAAVSMPDVADEMTVSVAMEDLRAIRDGIVAAHPTARRKLDAVFDPLLDFQKLPQPSKVATSTVELHRRQVSKTSLVMSVVPHPVEEMRATDGRRRRNS